MKNNFSKSPIKAWCIKQALIHPKRTILFTMFVTIFMASGMQFLIMDDDMMKMLPEHLDSRRTWDAVQNEFGSTEIIFLAFGKLCCSARARTCGFLSSPRGNKACVI